MPQLSLSLHDLACAAVGDFEAVSQEGRTVIATLLRQDARFAEQLSELEAMARDAGVDNVMDGLETRRRFDILMSEPWDHPADALEEDPEDVWYEQLLHLATTLVDRADDAARLLDVERRLEAAYAVHKLGEETFERLVERLDALTPEAAERVLQRLARHLRHRRREAGGETPARGNRTGGHPPRGERVQETQTPTTACGQTTVVTP